LPTAKKYSPQLLAVARHIIRRKRPHWRELYYHGIREFCNIKTVWIGKPAS